MACISKEELNYFKEYCKNKGIDNNFLNYIAWKDRYKRTKGVLKW